MKKITSEKLLKYGAFSVAIMGVANANGQIVYTDIADATVAPGGNYVLDLNSDATGDYTLRVNTAANFAFIFPDSGPAATVYNSNAIVGFAQSGFFYPSNLAPGTVIDATNGVFSSARGDFNYDGCSYPGSEFCGGTDGYVGFHLMLGANTHYGWARIQVAADASSIIVKDYAYEATPGASIQAGQTLGVDENSINNVRIVASEKSISLFNVPENTNFNLFSISGQSLMKGSTTGNIYVIEANSTATGVYILELNDVNTNTVIRKKITL